MAGISTAEFIKMTQSRTIEGYEDLLKKAKRYGEGALIISVGMDGYVGERKGEVQFTQTVKPMKGEVIMQLTTRYMENLPGQSYKTKQFERVVVKTLPDDISKEDFIEEAKKSQGAVEALVQQDIQRHISMSK